jgi:hypothetical protein
VKRFLSKCSVYNAGLSSKAPARCCNKDTQMMLEWFTSTFKSVGSVHCVMVIKALTGE